MHDFDYNTQREDIILKEYGRNVQGLTEYIKNIKDKDEQLKLAKTLVKLMKVINPSSTKDSDEVDQKTWDHLHIISDFEMDLEDAPYEKPTPESVGKKPLKVEYGTGRIKLRHYGKNVELIINKIAEESDPEAQLAGISKVGKMMKKFYSDFNKDIIEDDVIASQIESISRGKVKVDLEAVKEQNLFFVSKADLINNTGTNNNQSTTNISGKKNNNNNRNRNNNNNRNKNRNKHKRN